MTAISHRKLVLLDPATGERLVDLPLDVKDSDVRGVAFSPDGRIIAAGYTGESHTGGVVMWDVSTRKRLRDEPLDVKEGSVWSVAFSPNGKTVAAGYGDDDSRGHHTGGVVLWDVTTRKRLVDEEFSLPFEVSSVSFSPDGKTIAAGLKRFQNGGVATWKANDYKTFESNAFLLNADVLGLAFSPDGKTIAAGCEGVMLWDLGARKPVVDQPLAANEFRVTSVAFSPDGKTVAAVSLREEVGIVLFDVDLESWQRHAGRIANRNFTREEWGEYFPETPYRATFPDLPIPPEVTPK